MVLEFKNAQDVNLKVVSTQFQSKHKQNLDKHLSELIKNGANADVYKDISKSYKGLKKYDKAITNLKKAKEISQFDPEIHYELGINYLLSEQNNEARKSFIRSIRLDNSNLNAQLQLGIVHELIDEEQMAICIYKKIIEENPTFIQGYIHLAGLYIELEMFEDAINLFAQIIKTQPDYYRAYLGIGICFDRMEKFSQAVRYYKKYIVKKPYGKTARAIAQRLSYIYAKMPVKNTTLSLVK